MSRRKRDRGPVRLVAMTKIEREALHAIRRRADNGLVMTSAPMLAADLATTTREARRLLHRLDVKGWLIAAYRRNAFLPRVTAGLAHQMADVARLVNDAATLDARTLPTDARKIVHDARRMLKNCGRGHVGYPVGAAWINDAAMISTADRPASRRRAG